MRDKAARKLLVQRRNAARAQVEARKPTLAEEVLGEREFASRAQHLEDARMTGELGRLLARHRRRERALLVQWREMLPGLVQQAVMLDHWSGLPTDELRVKEQGLQRHVGKCKGVAQQRDALWRAAGADVDMHAAIMGDVTQFLVFVTRERDLVAERLGALRAELEAMGDDGQWLAKRAEAERLRRYAESGVLEAAEAAPAQRNHVQADAAGQGKTGQGKCVLGSFAALREQLMVNRLKSGLLVLEREGAELVEYLHLRQQAHLQQAQQTHRHVRDRTILLAHGPGSEEEGEQRAHRDREESGWAEEAEALLGGMSVAEAREQKLHAVERDQRAARDEQKTVLRTSESARSRADEWRGSLRQVARKTSIEPHDSRREVNTKTEGAGGPSVTGAIGHVTTMPRSPSNGSTRGDGGGGARVGRAGVGGLGAGRVVGGEALMRELGLIPLEELRQRCDAAGRRGDSLERDGAGEALRSGGRRLQQVLRERVAGLDKEELEKLVSFSGLHSFVPHEVVAVRRKDGALALATVVRELPGGLVELTLLSEAARQPQVCVYVYIYTDLCVKHVRTTSVFPSLSLCLALSHYPSDSLPQDQQSIPSMAAHHHQSIAGPTHEAANGFQGRGCSRGVGADRAARPPSSLDKSDRGLDYQWRRGSVRDGGACPVGGKGCCHQVRERRGRRAGCGATAQSGAGVPRGQVRRRHRGWRPRSAASRPACAGTW